MWLPKIGSRLLFSLIMLSGISCAEHNGDGVIYRSVSSLPTNEMMKRVCSYPPAKRVDLYLYGVENFRPSDYALLPIECFDDQVGRELGGRLSNSSSGTRTFAIIYALYEGWRRGVSIDRKISYVKECLKFFEEKSPCHRLADQIDKDAVDSHGNL
ncbi:hypothetical protein K6X12_20970 [Xanthomonas euvesicatoria pv. allii]|uniref:hypothetical protein n=1 Tax=Xanthomonas euvesicatoria TaxID=456327 RepID=UPI002406E6B4|nr:hypothetical protein [Xanthomonas euvesicatoria]MCP3041534.1 hypothetical protein [Xanthomonas euvesicatoria pv. allii]MCP3053519.1 hypothetical protein [Xanthomonas euvesicatoria pv. allii]